MYIKTNMTLVIMNRNFKIEKITHFYTILIRKKICMYVSAE